jgi:hypothetical protein
VVESVTLEESEPEASNVPFLKMRSVPPERDTAKWTHWLEMEPVLAYSLHEPASHTYIVPNSMLTPIDAG